MKRRTKIHYGDTYGQDVYVACGANIRRVEAATVITVERSHVTCRNCRRAVDVARSEGYREPRVIRDMQKAHGEYRRSDANMDDGPDADDLRRLRSPYW